jgi:hypothetical protein
MNQVTPEQLRQAILSTHRRMDDLVHEARCLQSGNPVNVERVMEQLAAMRSVVSILTLPRGYGICDNPKRKYGFHVRLNGREVDPAQFAFDIATGWLDEVADQLDDILSRKYPNRCLAIAPPAAPTAKESEVSDAR